MQWQEEQDLQNPCLPDEVGTEEQSAIEIRSLKFTKTQVPPLQLSKPEARYQEYSIDERVAAQINSELNIRRRGKRGDLRIDSTEE